ncbi:M-phase inducer phosphatase 3 isoform X1 [Suncus etruscus]|uniref:M-phase inducer phosphatase 3 isoform X1 n=1 Tax=Suncus etruscus TaxID=109475 RepID=UPI00210F9279|nr:M-phase inducer phosphatase 3 isoform X1 [Suncus etruscus]
MSAELLSTGEEGNPGSGPSFRSKQRKILNRLLERDTSFTTCTYLPRTPVSKVSDDSANLSILSGGTPKCRLDLSNLSDREMPATQFSASIDFDETGYLDSSGPQIQIAAFSFQQFILENNPVQLLCSTPNALDQGCRKKDTVSCSFTKKKENDILKQLDWRASRNQKFEKRSGGPYMSPLSLMNNEILVESEMKYLESPIAVSESNKNPILREDLAEEISGELMEFSLEDQDETKASLTRSSLYRSPSLPENLNRPRQKQVIKFRNSPTLDQERKKNCSNHKELRAGASLKKTTSLCDINIIQMLEEDSNQGHLIGDFSKVCVLPTVSGRHQELKYINPETVAALLSGKFQHLIEKFYIIDCRFPYEYLGGHIQGSLNLYSQEELYNFFFKKPIVPVDTQKRIIIVFHCEFSSERGPRMCRSLREEDRALNCYPALYYPELYILRGGYRDFFPEYPPLLHSLLLSRNCCETPSYCPMHHQDHKAELLRCRSQSRAGKGSGQLQEHIALLVKDGNS